MDSRVTHKQSAPGSSAGFWQQLSTPGQTGEFEWAWLNLLCEQLPGVVSALLLETQVKPEHNNAELVPLAVWPHAGQDVEKLSPLVSQAQDTASGVLLSLDEGAENKKHYGLAYPLHVEEKLIAIIGIELVAESETDLQYAMQQLQWGMAWLEAHYFRRRFQAQDQLLERLRAGHDVLAVVLNEPGFDAACMAFTAELATQLGCDRVSIGFVQQGHVHVQALSHSVEPGRKMKLVRAIAGAMEEALDQQTSLLLPALVETGPEPTAHILLAHQKLSRENEGESVLSVLLKQDERCMGAVTLERPAELPFTADEQTFCSSVSALAAAALHDKQLNDLSAWKKLSASVHQFLVSLLGAGYLKRKILFTGLIFLALFSTLVNTQLRISADSMLRGEVQRSIVAPFSGYLEQSRIRPGDLVKKGEEFARLDDHELRLERVKWASQREQFKRQYEEAVATRSRAQAGILMAQIAQADARLAMTESRLQRTHIVAPFDGIVVRGDLSQRLGASVQEGEVLFELAPLDAYRVVLSVDERDIALVREQQQGYLIVAALPGDRFAFTINRITPISVPAEGKNTFQVEASLQTNDARLRPGMEGVGKIDTGEQPMIHVWTRRMVHWLRLQWWAWFG